MVWGPDFGDGSSGITWEVGVGVDLDAVDVGNVQGVGVDQAFDALGLVGSQGVGVRSTMDGVGLGSSQGVGVHPSMPALSLEAAQVVGVDMAMDSFSIENAKTIGVHLSATAIAAPTWRSTNFTDSGVTTATTLTLVAPSGIQNGNVLIATIWWGNTPGTVTPPAGWLGIISTTVGTNVQQSFYKIASGESGNYVFSWVTARGYIAEIHRISENNPLTGAGTGFVIDAVAGGTGSATDPIAPSVTTTVANCLVLAVATQATTLGQTETPPASWAERSDHAIAAGPSQFGITRVFSAIGATGTATFDSTQALAVAYIAQSIAIAPGPITLAA